LIFLSPLSLANLPYRVLTCHVPNLMSIFFTIGLLPQNLARSVAHYDLSLTSLFLRRRLVGPTPNPQPGGPPLVVCPRLLFNIFAATLHIWWPSPPSATWGSTMLWWQGTQLTWLCVL
jgi:hypothetical protein